MAVSSEHEQELTRDLAPSQREALIRLLHQVCHHPRLIEGVHPGFADPNAYQIREEPEQALRGGTWYLPSPMHPWSLG